MQPGRRAGAETGPEGPSIGAAPLDIAELSERALIAEGKLLDYMDYLEAEVRRLRLALSGDGPREAAEGTP